MRKLMIVIAVVLVAAACATAATAVTTSGATEAYLPALQGVGTFIYPDFNPPRPPQGPGFTVDSARYPAGATLKVGPIVFGQTSTSVAAGSMVTVCMGVFDGSAGPLIGTESCTTFGPTSPAFLGLPGSIIYSNTTTIDIPSVGLLSGEHNYVVQSRVSDPAGATVGSTSSPWTRIRW